MAQNRDKRNEAQVQDDLDEHTVFINRCAKTVKGGRRMSFSAVIVVGDREGKVGVGFGKANEVSDAMRKGGEAARRAMRKITLAGKTVPHEVEGVCDVCGDALIIRDDDNPETVKNRLVTYHKQTEPVINYYKDKLIVVEGVGSVESISQKLLSALEA
jgi:adenylate kinase family enzyme